MFSHMCNSASYAVAFSGISFKLPFRLALSTTLCQLKAILLYSKLKSIKKFDQKISLTSAGPRVVLLYVFSRF